MDDRKLAGLVAYCHVSTRRQGESGLGLEAQREDIARHSAAIGRPVLASFVEVESGKRSDRPELALAQAHARRARATLVIAKLDRLARNVAFLANLMEAGVDFVACDQPSANRLTIHILAAVAVAEDEARRISERTKAALAAAKARGVRLGRDNLTPEGGARGRIAAARKLREIADRDHAHILPLVRELHVAGLSQRAIARHLNDLGHLTRAGKAWHQVAVGRLLDRG